MLVKNSCHSGFSILKFILIIFVVGVLIGGAFLTYGLFFNHSVFTGVFCKIMASRMATVGTPAEQAQMNKNNNKFCICLLANMFSDVGRGVPITQTFQHVLSQIFNASTNDRFCDITPSTN